MQIRIASLNESPQPISKNEILDAGVLNIYSEQALNWNKQYNLNPDAAILKRLERVIEQLVSDIPGGIGIAGYDWASEDIFSEERVKVDLSVTFVNGEKWNKTRSAYYDAFELTGEDDEWD